MPARVRIRIRPQPLVSLLTLAASLVASTLPALARQATPAASPATSPAVEAPACAAGSSGIGDAYFPTAGNGGYNVLHYDLDLDLDVPRGAITAGRATIEAVALLDLCAFNLDFRGLTVDAITVDGRPARSVRDGKELTVLPGAPIPVGADFVVEIAYQGRPDGETVPSGPGQALLTTPTPAQPQPAPGTPSPARPNNENEGAQFGGGWFTAPETIFVAGEPGGAETWYPVNGHPADKATYSLRLTVADPYAVVANGVLTETIDEGSATTSVWESRDPIASYLVTLHAGRLETVETTGLRGLPIRTAFAANVPDDQREVFARLPEILETFESMFGPYPFEVAGATVVGVPLGFALETQTIPIFGIAPGGDRLTRAGAAQLEQILVHETAHQWFGDTVTPLRWQDIWLNEGFASYAEALWLERSDSPRARDRQLLRWYDALARRSTDRAAASLRNPAARAAQNAREVLAAFERALGQPLPADQRAGFLEALGAEDAADLDRITAEAALTQLEALGVPVSFFPGADVLTGDPGPENLFDSGAVYQRGALTLHALRQEVGDDAFFAILQAWPRRYANGNATTADFVDLAEEVSGRELSPLFDAWLFALPLPPLAIGGETRTADPAATPAP